MARVLNRYRLEMRRRKRHQRMLIAVWSTIVVCSAHLAVVYFVWPRVFGFEW